ncbi:MAG TPA: hypothetical protein DEQ61_08300 [Streptomyces sp.]|nr:hypothetical protein [Streptomyces sp.]
MSPLERLLAEELPTGTFGGARDERPVAVATARAAANRRALEDAIGTRRTVRPRLRLITDDAKEAA